MKVMKKDDEKKKQVFIFLNQELIAAIMSVVETCRCVSMDKD